MRTALAALSLLALPVAAFAQIPGAPDASRVADGTYKVESAHSQVVFTVNHLGFSEYSGQFVMPTGMLVIDRAHPANDKVEVVFPIDKVSTTVGALDEHLKKPEFFDAVKFPEGKFVSTKVTVSGQSATIAGNLTLKGVTKPVILAAHFVGAGNNPMSKKTNFGFRATTTIKRSDFGVSADLPMVSDDVKLVINVTFES